MGDEAVASDESEFWERRHDLSLSPITEEDVAKQGVGRERHLVLLAHLNDGDLITELQPIRDRLGDFECFEPITEQNLHITVKVFGNVVENPSGEAEYSLEEERELADELGSVLDDFLPFHIEFPRYNLFPTAVYAEVDDDGRFREMNRRVCGLSNVPVLDRDTVGFIPHLTLGHFTQQSGYERLVEYLETNRRLDLPTTRVEQVKFVALDFSKGRFPPYETIETYQFE